MLKCDQTLRKAARSLVLATVLSVSGVCGALAKIVLGLLEVLGLVQFCELLLHHHCLVHQCRKRADVSPTSPASRMNGV
jgi:hypothetical protein